MGIFLKGRILTDRLSVVLDNRLYRVCLGIFGGYAFTAGFFAFVSVLLAQAGAARIEAFFWAILTSFLVYTAVVIWAVATAQPARVTGVLIGGALVMVLSSPFLATPTTGL